MPRQLEHTKSAPHHSGVQHEFEPRVELLHGLLSTLLPCYTFKTGSVRFAVVHGPWDDGKRGHTARQLILALGLAVETPTMVARMAEKTVKNCILVVVLGPDVDEKDGSRGWEKERKRGWIVDVEGRLRLLTGNPSRFIP